METEYIRGKIQERAGALTARAPAYFDSRGNDVWAARSGRVFQSDSIPDMAGGEGGYSSPVTGNGMGDINRLVGGRSRKPEHPGKLHPIGYWKKVAQHHLSGGDIEAMLNPYDAHRALSMDWRGGASPFFTKTGAPRAYMMHKSLHGSGLWDTIKGLGKKVLHEFTDPDSKLRGEIIPKATAIINTGADIATFIGPMIPPPFGQGIMAAAQGAKAIANGVSAVNMGVGAVQRAAKGDFKGALQSGIGAFGSYNNAKGALGSRATNLASYGEQKAAKAAAAVKVPSFAKSYEKPSNFMTTATSKASPKFMTTASRPPPPPPKPRDAPNPFVAPRGMPRESQPYSSGRKAPLMLQDIGEQGYSRMRAANAMDEGANAMSNPENAARMRALAAKARQSGLVGHGRRRRRGAGFWDTLKNAVISPFAPIKNAAEAMINPSIAFRSRDAPQAPSETTGTYDKSSSQRRQRQPVNIQPEFITNRKGIKVYNPAGTNPYGQGGSFQMDTPRQRLAQMGANLSPFGDAIGAQNRHSAAMNRIYGAASPDYSTLSLLTKGAERAEGAAKPRHGLKGRPNARAQIVGRIMKERGVSLPEASKIVKAEGLY